MTPPRRLSGSGPLNRRSKPKQSWLPLLLLLLLLPLLPLLPLLLLLLLLLALPRATLPPHEVFRRRHRPHAGLP